MQGSTVESPIISNSSTPHAIAATAHAEHPDYRVLGLLVFLVSESLMFGEMFAA
nr:hypothetical protein [Pleurocapsa sp. PCC 7327]